MSTVIGLVRRSFVVYIVALCTVLIGYASCTLSCSFAASTRIHQLVLNGAEGTTPLSRSMSACLPASRAPSSRHHASPPKLEALVRGVNIAVVSALWLYAI